MSIGKLYAFLLFFVCLSGNKNALAQLNLNIHNGLPSNHVYQMVKDKYGYLWMATTNGVVRYNGYSLKSYTTADGLPSNDVWSIHLDHKERLWLLCFGNILGYIHKNKYYETYVKDYKYGIAADRVAEYGDGIAFVNKYQAATGFSLFKEKNDTLINLKNALTRWWFFLNNKAEFIYGSLEGQPYLHTYTINDTGLRLKRTCIYDTSILFLKTTHHLEFIYNNYNIHYNPNQNIVYALNVSTCKLDTLLFPDPIAKILYVDNNLYVLTSINAYKLDSTLATTYSAPVARLTEGYVTSPDDIVYLLEDDFWGRSIATQKSGLFILPRTMSPFRKLQPFDNLGYKHIGQRNDSIGYWWNETEGSLAYLKTNGERIYNQMGRRNHIAKILPYDRNRSIAYFNYSIALINSQTLTPRPLKIYNKVTKGLWFRHDASDALIYRDTIYTVNSTGFFKNYLASDTIFPTAIYNDRLTHVVYDSLRNIVWGYNPSNIILYSRGKVAEIHNTLPRSFGITRFEQILFDNKYGNIFVKDGYSLLCIDPHNYSCRRLFPQCNLSDAKFFIQNNILIAAGRFGVLFSSILGAGKFSDPIVYYNDKYHYYLTVDDVQLSKKGLLLNTDNGLYTMDIPTDTFYRNAQTQQPFSIILSYTSDLFKLSINDSISVNQNNRKFVFDVVKPSGSGQVRYQYLIDGIDSGWHELNSNELNLPELQPGQYHTLLLKVKDDVWKSAPIRLKLYIIPFWWQINPGKTILWLLGVTLLAGLIATTVFITRKIIMQNNLKRTKLLELEIKSIHSQINPHFIFNTLNTTLHYIVKKKLDEAYDHVSSFSSLLRAYLKSSRNRYITLGEEINNLRNYIHLQQTRFENAFTYEIATDIPQGKIIYIPSLLLQPIVENAINHGLLPKDAPGHLKLAFIADPETNLLTCIIDDNGVGRKTHVSHMQKTEPKRESYGSQLISELVDIFNKYENAGIEINYIDKELPETGTTVIITIKNARNHG